MSIRTGCRAVLRLATGLSTPAFAHGSGLLLVLVGGPLLLACCALMLIRAVFFTPPRWRGRGIGMTLLAAPLGLLGAPGPLGVPVLERLLRDFEVAWSLLVPLVLAVLGWIMQNRIRRGLLPARK
ncbi:hypothetical protein H5407_09715 [Mitsuaria sp. WAJ17]|uniref:hypothetical protein n=1 Tax=Mitsuaria sp. WAJ17 TaxID=2761452 RepID=UPI001603E843|nr:hypothetical protein [Mitsuaria sp. WAJ17]MBB2485503.1 hypothetical protein [Mitsuaria sp. WAJ17]